jgi:Kinesin motor domain
VFLFKSRLTFYLRDVFGGISRTGLIANILNEDQYCFETINTLRFASKAKTIQTTPRINFVAEGSEEDLKEQIAELMNQVQLLRR